MEKDLGDSRLNVIVLVLDSLRPDYIGCYGNPKVKTPNIDRIAGEGTLFREAYSEGVPTGPARTAWFTGKYTFPFRGWQPLKQSDSLLAEILTINGYDTAFVTDTSPIFWDFLSMPKAIPHIITAFGSQTSIASEAVLMDPPLLIEPISLWTCTIP